MMSGEAAWDSSSSQSCSVGLRSGFVCKTLHKFFHYNFGAHFVHSGIVMLEDVSIRSLLRKESVN